MPDKAGETAPPLSIVGLHVRITLRMIELASTNQKHLREDAILLKISVGSVGKPRAQSFQSPTPARKFQGGNPPSS